MAQTYRDLISSSLRLLGVKAQGQTATAAEAVDGLAVLNAMIDEWNASDALLYTTKTFVKQLNPAKQIYTIGPGAEIDVPVRPTRFYGAWLRNNNVSPATDSPMTILSDTEYGDIVAKTVTTTIPYYLYLDRQFPTGNVYLWPVPSDTSYSLVLQFLTNLNSAVGLDDVVNLPPAYANALRWNLACDLSVEYGLEPTPMMTSKAATTKMFVQQANFQGYRLEFDDASNGLYSINSDSFRNY